MATRTRARLDRYLLVGGAFGALFVLIVLVLVGLFVATTPGIRV